MGGLGKKRMGSISVPLPPKNINIVGYGLLPDSAFLSSHLQDTLEKSDDQPGFKTVELR